MCVCVCPCYTDRIIKFCDQIKTDYYYAGEIRNKEKFFGKEEEKK